MSPTFFHCLFMFTCFGEKLSPFGCPPGFTCFSAPSDGIVGSDAKSILCPNATNLFIYSASLRLTSINTIVIGQTKVQSRQSDLSVTYQLSAVSLVFDECDLTELDESNSIFKLFNKNTLKYLTFLKLELFQLNWRSLHLFADLHTLYIENTNLLTLDSTFASLTLPKLHTILIKSSKLSYIDREAFSGKAASLQKLILSNNRLHNLIPLMQTNRILNKLWHFDISGNQLTSLPVDLHQYMPNLQELYLAFNKFKYYAYAPLAPWLDIAQLMLEANGKPANIPRNTIFYTKEMNELKEKITNWPADRNLPAYFLQSVMQYPRYRKPIGGLQMWSQLNLDDRDNKFDYYPDNLFLNINGKLTIGKPTQDGTPPEEKITGIDLSQFSFDSATNVNEYRQSRAFLLSHLEASSSLQLEQAIRIGLFSKRMFDYFTGATEMPDEQIKLMADLLVDFLDEAALVKSDVLLILWKSADVDLETAKKSFPSSDSRSAAILTMLMNRISSHSALIGIELLDGFMVKHNMGLWFAPTEEQCITDHEGIQLEMQFIGHFYVWLKSNYFAQLYGVALNSNCYQCLQIALLKSCRDGLFQVGDPAIADFDLITLTTDANSAHIGEGQEVLGFDKIDKVKLKFNARDLPNTVQSRGLLYVVSEVTGNVREKTEKIGQIATGYFIKKAAI